MCIRSQQGSPLVGERTVIGAIFVELADACLAEGDLSLCVGCVADA